MSVYLSVTLPVYLCLSICLSSSLSVCLSTSLRVCLSVFILVYICICLATCLYCYVYSLPLCYFTQSALPNYQTTFFSLLHVLLCPAKRFRRAAHLFVQL